MSILSSADFEKKPSMFGLRIGRITIANNAAHNGGWYNREGKKIGWGDLDWKDLERVARELPVGESFIVLGERESYWNFVTHLSPIGAANTTDRSETAPGIAYIKDNARIVVRGGKIYYRSYSGSLGSRILEGTEIMAVGHFNDLI